MATETGKIWAQKQAETVRNMAIEYHSQTLYQTVTDEEKKQQAGEQIPRSQANTWQKFASELHGKMDYKARDWQRVAYTELVDSQKQGAAHRKLEESRSDGLVYKMPMPTACSQCKHLYLLPDGKTPKLFRLKDMLNNGTNIGCKAHPTKGGKVVPGGRPDGAETLKLDVLQFRREHRHRRNNQIGTAVNHNRRCRAGAIRVRLRGAGAEQNHAGFSR